MLEIRELIGKHIKGSYINQRVGEDPIVARIVGGYVINNNLEAAKLVLLGVKGDCLYRFWINADGKYEVF